MTGEVAALLAAVESDNVDAAEESVSQADSPAVPDTAASQADSSSQNQPDLGQLMDMMNEQTGEESGTHKFEPSESMVDTSSQALVSEDVAAIPVAAAVPEAASAVVDAEAQSEHIRSLVAETVAEQVATQMAQQVPSAPVLPVQTPPVFSDEQLKSSFIRLLPELLQDEEVRQHLFASLAIEMVTKPSTLGALSGLRDFVKTEIEMAINESKTADVSGGSLQLP